MDREALRRLGASVGGLGLNIASGVLNKLAVRAELDKARAALAPEPDPTALAAQAAQALQQIDPMRDVPEVDETPRLAHGFRWSDLVGEMRRDHAAPLLGEVATDG